MAMSLINPTSLLSIAAAALAMLAARSSLTASFLGLAGWSLLAVLAALILNPVVVEATVQSDAAVAGDVSTFAMWSALSRGYDLVLGLVPLAFLGITLADLRAPQPATPRWASGLAMAGAALMLVGIVGATGLGIAGLGVLWGGAALPMLWFIWVGLKLAFIGDPVTNQYRPATGPQPFTHS